MVGAQQAGETSADGGCLSQQGDVLDSQDNAQNEQPTPATPTFSQIAGSSGATGGQTNTAPEGTRRNVTGKGEKQTERRAVWVVGSSDVPRCE